MKARLHVLTATFAAIVALAYVGILLKAHAARRLVVDDIAYGAQLAADVKSGENVRVDQNDGTAVVGVDIQKPSAARWKIVPIDQTAATRRWVALMSDEPLFYAPGGYVRIYANGLLLGEVRAQSSGAAAGGFLPSERQQTIFVPPMKTYGYRFELRERDHCAWRRCEVVVLGLSTFWRIYRIALIRESPRFVTAARK